MNETKDYMEIMAKSSESIKLLVEMTADVIEREVEYLDTMIDHYQESRLFMGAVKEKLDDLKANLAKHLEDVEEFVKDEQTETLQ